MLDGLISVSTWITQNMTDFVIPFVLVLSALVFVHEWGHYIVARLCGVRVEVFSIGFGKELFGFTSKAGTRWKFCLIPLGGYVKMFGDVDPASARHDDAVEDEETGEKRDMTEEEKNVAFFSKPVWKRAAIVFAGPAINFLFAIIIFTGVFAHYGKTLTPAVAGAVVVGGSAYEAGVQPHDRITTINEREIDRFEAIQRQVTINLDEAMDVQIERDGKVINLDGIRAKRLELKDRYGFKHSRGLLGILSVGSGFNLSDIEVIGGVDVNTLDLEQKRKVFSDNVGGSFIVTVRRAEDVTDEYLIAPKREDNEALLNGESEVVILAAKSENDRKNFTVFGAFLESLRETEEVVSGTMQALGQMFTGIRSPKELGGIIRIGAIAGDAVQAGFVAILLFTALLSINLGLLNLFPIPVLDGGHLVFYFIEAIKGSPVPEKVQEYAFGTGMVLILGLMLFSNLNDLFQLVLS